MAFYDIDGSLLDINPKNELDGLRTDRILVWHDEFDGDGIDSNKWRAVYGRQSGYGTYMYPEDANRNTATGDGLSYFAMKDNPLSNAVYSCPFLDTNNKFEFRYGLIEAKIKFPSSSPHHSTFWMLGANSDRVSSSESVPFDETKGVLFPSCGEIDIAEYDGGVGARTHWSTNGFDSSSGYTQGGNVGLTSTPNEWHIYSCEWTESAITFYVDGVQKGTWNTSSAAVNGWNPFNHPFFIILNCVPYLTGSPTWDVAETQVKWVRVYAPVDVTEYIKETAISIPSTASIAVGERHWLGTPTFTPANPSDMTIRWESGNEAVCTCYGGMLIGVGAGTTVVTAKSKHGAVAFCKVTVA